jgi:hypothetical protein
MADLLWQPSCIRGFFAVVAPDLGVAFGVVDGVCAKENAELAKIAKAKAILKIDFMTSPKTVRVEIINQARQP